MEISFGKYKLKVWLIIVFSLYMYSIMFRSARIITYFYYYIIPIIYILLHNGQFFHFIKKFKRGYLSVFSAMFLLVLLGSFAMPLINDSGDLSFILQGPIKYFFINFIQNIFLLILYINSSKGKYNLIEYSLYFICSNLLYVLGTLLICAIPELHDYIINEIYMNQKAQDVIKLSFYYTRIGWSGFSNYEPSAFCSIGVILCILSILKSHKEHESTLIFYIAIFLLLIGNFCYARTGVIVSLICLFLFIMYMAINNRSVKVLLFSIALISIVLLVGAYFIHNNELVEIWFNWAFAQVNSYIETGDYRTESVNSLFEMYGRVPGIATFLLGDGSYGSIDDGGYYMGVDVGWLRLLYYFGFFFSFITYATLVPLIKKFNKNISGFVDSADLKLLSLFFLIFFIIFELKGEIWFQLYSVLLPFCLMDSNIYVSKSMLLCSIGKVDPRT